MTAEQTARTARATTCAQVPACDPILAVALRAQCMTVGPDRCYLDYRADYVHEYLSLVSRH